MQLRPPEPPTHIPRVPHPPGLHKWYTEYKCECEWCLPQAPFCSKTCSAVGVLMQAPIFVQKNTLCGWRLAAGIFLLFRNTLFATSQTRTQLIGHVYFYIRIGKKSNKKNEKLLTLESFLNFHFRLFRGYGTSQIESAIIFGPLGIDSQLVASGGLPQALFRRWKFAAGTFFKR